MINIDDDLNFGPAQRNTLEIMTLAEMDGRISETALFEYCKSMKPIEEDFREILDCVDTFDITYYYDTLFTTFANFLSRDKYIEYRSRYKRVFSWALCDKCEALDKKFGIELDDMYRPLPLGLCDADI